MPRKDWLKLHLENWAHIHFECGHYIAFGSNDTAIFAQTRHSHRCERIRIGRAPTPELAALTALTLRLANAR